MLSPYTQGTEIFRDPDDGKYGLYGDGLYERCGTSYSYCSWGAGIPLPQSRFVHPQHARRVLSNFRVSEVVRPASKGAIRDLGPELGFELTGLLFADGHVVRLPYELEGVRAWWQPCDE